MIEYEIAAEDMDRVRGKEIIEFSQILRRASGKEGESMIEKDRPKVEAKDWIYTLV